MRGAYVGLVRLVRSGLRAVGGLWVLDRLAQRSRLGLWARSLLAIYDLEDLTALNVPWWTFDSAQVVAAHLSTRPDARVFEWGSGASTRWVALRAGEVVAVEHDPAWAASVQRHLPDGAEVRTVEPTPGPGAVTSRKRGYEGLDFTDYVRSIDDVGGRFDLVIIDGRARQACLEPALRHLAPGGLIVFDNVDRRRYRDAIASHPGLEVLWTRGLTPCLPYPTRTALIRVPDA